MIEMLGINSWDLLRKKVFYETDEDNTLPNKNEDVCKPWHW
jgi:hypothetical protein